jgi:hypothetical protein
MDRIFCLGALLAGCALVWFAQGQSAAPRVDGATAQRLSQNPRGAVAVAADAERPDDRRDWSSRFEPLRLHVAKLQGEQRKGGAAVSDEVPALGIERARPPAARLALIRLQPLHAALNRGVANR